MRPAALLLSPVLVLVLVLVLVRDVTGVPVSEIRSQCLRRYPARSCGDGWVRMNSSKCIKLLLLHRTFSEAQEHCVRLGARLVSIHSADDFSHVLCLSIKTNRRDPTTGDHLWVGGKGDAPTSGYRWTDGTALGFSRWHDGQPDNTAAHVCVEMNYKKWGKWNNANCSQKRNFVCMKQM